MSAGTCAQLVAQTRNVFDGNSSADSERVDEVVIRITSVIRANGIMVWPELSDSAATWENWP